MDLSGSSDLFVPHLRSVVRRRAAEGTLRSAARCISAGNPRMCPLHPGMRRA